ncbi:RNA polymerase II subunit A C-terminal domain phosphatase [Fukomys damarensis]|uniref:RNA polymerase II subunit A C-terminal domain phosphatase n=1 Tax=Fukomys damarensis TaxID=885580 RepID=A0A091DVC8_FUKDA|nr:RNA polymerase II subunit A C-terminal domain phosphatase [Fukomys damarensis]
MRKKVNHSSKDADVLEQVPSVKDPEEGRHIPGVKQNNGLGKPAQELNGGEAVPGTCGKADERDSWPPSQTPSSISPSSCELADIPKSQASCEHGGETSLGAQPPQVTSGPDLDFDLSSDSESSESEGQKSSTSDGESEEKRGWEKAPATQDGTRIPQQGAIFIPESLDFSPLVDFLDQLPILGTTANGPVWKQIPQLTLKVQDGKGEGIENEELTIGTQKE